MTRLGTRSDSLCTAGGQNSEHATDVVRVELWKGKRQGKERRGEGAVIKTKLPQCGIGRGTKLKCPSNPSPKGPSFLYYFKPFQTLRYFEIKFKLAFIYK